MNLIPSILLVDDEERFVKSLNALLKHYDYECTEALSGTEAIRLLKEKNFDLALLDVDLPDMLGCDILDFIRTSRIKTTAIMLTGVSNVETAVEAMKQGAYDFLSKPINHELLIKTVNKAFQYHQVSRELEASEKRFKVLAEASLEGIVIHKDGKLLEANNQFFSMFDYSEKELIQSNFLEKILPSTSLQIVSQHIESSFFGNNEITGMRKDGTEFPLETNSRSINYFGKPARVCVLRDLSNRVRAEKEKLDLQKKLARSNNLNSLGLMAGSIAHDLNNILSGVVSYPELLLLQMHESDRFYTEIKKIQEAGKRAAAVVADLVVLARGGSSSPTVGNINDIILSHLESIEHNERLANYPNVVIQTSLQENLHNTCCSYQHIHKLLLNLIGNALEAVQEDGLIRITTQNCRFTHPLSLNHASTYPEDYVVITIADNGPGIQQKDLDHIFDPFYSTKRMGKSGTGLGLSIVWNTVQDHNGWLEVRDNNPGAIFEIYLPSTREETRPTKDVDINRPLRGNGEMILLIDDLSEQNETMEKLLASLGYKTYSVTSGEEGIAFLQSQAVDLVLIDMIMGDGLNGRETYERILQVRPGQKAIIISGYSRHEETEKAKALGISHFLEKPVTLSKLSLAIKQALFGNGPGPVHRRESSK
jgi:two-component system, cell cycle sensor histidine kinase and response regulator CckA